MKRLATLLSLMISPQLYGGLIACYLWWYCGLGGLEALVMLVLTQTVLPLAPILLDTYWGKTDIFVTEREKRWKYYILTTASYVLGIAYLAWRGLDVYMPLYISYIVLALVLALITLKWKISVHTAGIAGPTTLLVYFVGFNMALLYLLLIPVSWARHKLKAHTPAQLIAGAFLSTVLTAIICDVYVKNVRNFSLALKSLLS